MNNITPENIRYLAPNEVFVFGSNYAGRHGRGAALLAVRKFGARNGHGMGLAGRSYGIATKGHELEVLPLRAIKIQVDRFLKFANANRDKHFFVTEIGCGLAGYSPRDIAPMFAGQVPANVSLPIRFWKINSPSPEDTP